MRGAPGGIEIWGERSNSTSRKKLKIDSSIAGLRRLAAAIARSTICRSSSLTG
jgi:hypothetical protein